MWGRRALPQRGHRLRAGAPSFQAPARLLRDFDLDFFFLGTGTTNSLRNGPARLSGFVPERVEGGPTFVTGCLDAVAGGLIAIPAADRADPSAVVPAEGGDREIGRAHV